MYQNVPYEDDREEIKGKDLEILKVIVEKETKFRGKRYTEEIAHSIMLWLKYFRNENTDYYRLANSVIASEFYYSDNEISKIINNSIPLLRKKYNIDIVSKDPLILSSQVPFYEINENVK